MGSQRERIQNRVGCRERAPFLSGGIERLRGDAFEARESGLGMIRRPGSGGRKRACEKIRFSARQISGMGPQAAEDRRCEAELRLRDVGRRVHWSVPGLVTTGAVRVAWIRW